MNLDKIENVILATCALHNFLRSSRLQYYKTNEKYVKCSSLIDVNNCENGQLEDGQLEDAKKVRNEFCNYFNNEGKIKYKTL